MQPTSGPLKISQSSLRLPPLQEEMFLQGISDFRQGTYLQQLVISMHRPLQPDALLRAFNELVSRHAALRCSYQFDEAMRVTLDQHLSASVPFKIEDLSALDAAHQKARMEEFLRQDRARGFAPGDVPLMRVAVFALGGMHHQIVWTSHHAIMDGRSRAIALQEVMALEASPQTDLASAPDYALYLDWLSRQLPVRSRAFWKSQLEGMVEPSLMPLPVSTAPKYWGTRVLELDEEVTTRLRDFSRHAHVTLNTLLQAAWAIFLNRHSGSEDVLFGATRACRHVENVDTKRMVGLLINTVPLRAKPRRTTLLGDFLRDLQQQWVAIRDHEHTSLESIREWCEFNSASPLFHSIVVFERGKLQDLVSPGDASWTCELHQRTGVPLTLSAFDGKSMRLELHHDGDRYGGEDAEHYLSLLKQLLLSMLEGAERPIGELAMLSEIERNRVVVEWNQTSTAFPAQSRVEVLFEEKARHTPGATAIIHNGKTISYEELNSQADTFCDRLISGGLLPGGRVAVAMERSPELIIAMLAILKAGGAYVPLETNAPASRAQAILRQVHPHLLLIHGAEKIGWLPDVPDIRLVDLSIAYQSAESTPRGNFAGRVHDAAYIMFTSGSTGVPKGVIVPHRAIVRLVRDTNYCQISSVDVIGHLSNPAFDASTFEVWAALLNGAAVSIIESEVALSPNELEEKIDADRITTLWLTTALFNEFAREQMGLFGKLRYLLTGGEIVSPASFAAVAGACPALQLLNGYGPTETTTFATTFHYDAPTSHGPSIPIGRPIANTTIYILDERGEPVPVGVPGEIHIGGPGLALGYFDDPELTRQRFIPDPFDPGSNHRLYRSGDMGRFLLDGNIEFLGRMDQQIKLRGFRIELAEIEKALNAQEEVAESAVMGRFENGSCVGLSAFVILNRPATNGDEGRIATKLGALLPFFMVPDSIAVLDRLPVNANGKVDRAALARISISADFPIAANPAAPTTTESILTAIWQEIFAGNHIAIDDNFFALGGHSIRAVRCVLQIKKRLGVTLSSVAVFEDPTIRALAARVDAAKALLPDPSADLKVPHYEPVSTTFAKLAAAHSNLPAVIHGQQVVSYKELHVASDELAHQLLSVGLKMGEKVALHAQGCLALTVCVLGIFKAGGVLVLVDPSLPTLRKQMIMQEVETRFLLDCAIDAPLAALHPNCLHIPVDSNASNLSPCPSDAPALPSICASAPACIFFTSGTTGIPNAVLFSHQGVSHFMSWQRSRFNVSHEARVAQLTRPSFDVILRDLFLPLSSGGTCCIPEEEMEWQPGRVLDWLKREAITVLHAVPTRAQNWLAKNGAQPPVTLPALRHLFFSGEPLHDSEVNAWRRVAPNASIINLYGATETILVKSFYEVPTPAPYGIQSLGKALPESQMLVLNRELQMCGIEEPGQIVLRTPFRSLGYLNAPELQHQKFVPNPHSRAPDDLLYLTGDGGKYDAEGNVEFLGRHDHQVKINGVRIEPSEVRAVIFSLAGVQACQVLAVPGPDGKLLLTAFVVLSSGTSLDTTAIRSYLMDRLPAACLPARIRIMENIPINVNGKVDRHALLAKLDEINDPTDASPECGTVELITETFRTVLNQPSIGREDDFFELGGHSLLAMQVVARLSAKLGRPVSIRQLLTHTTPALLGAVLDQSSVPQKGGQPLGENANAYSPDSTVHALFAAQALRTPDAVAAIEDGRTLTFRQLDALSDHLAAHLGDLGVGLENRVALFTDRSLEMLVGLLGILKAGAAYVPVNPNAPKERIRYMLDDCRASAVVTTTTLAETIPSGSPLIITISSDASNICQLSRSQKFSLPAVSPQNACYLLYTSGSTGKPKGVAVEHRQIIAYLNALCARTGWNGHGCAALVQPLDVDSTVTLLFPPLLGGGRLRLISETTALDPQALGAAFDRLPIDLLKIAPSHLEALLESQFASRLLPREFLLIGGEVASEKLLAKLQELKTSSRIFNHYGPTETTVGVSTFEIEDLRTATWPLPIGQPLANARFHILDSNLESVSFGQSGDLYVGGPAVARGYANGPSLTAAAFLPDPFSDEPGARMYQTGDQARALPDGNFEFLGRTDNQIKIRGRRIDPREIELALEMYPNVNRALVIVTKRQGDSPALSAFLVTDQAERLLATDIRRFLQSHLPAALIPTHFVPLAALPRTGHGKLDLGRLSQMEIPPEEPAPASTLHDENQTVEERLATIWRGLLGVRKIELGQDFFELGGHSLLATRLASLINRQFGINLPLQKILQGATLEVMAFNISDLMADSLPATIPVTTVTPALSPPPATHELPLLPTQEGMWFLEHVQESGDPAYHINYIWRLKGGLNRCALESAWNQLVERHEALRCTFPSRSGHPCQVIEPFASFSISFIDLRAMDFVVRDAEAVRRANEWMKSPLDPAVGPLLRLAIIGITEAEHLFVFHAHHLVTDGWSMGVLYRELEVLYSAQIKNTGHVLTPLSQSYGDHVMHQTHYLRSQAYRKRLAEWCKNYRTTSSAIPIPTDFPRHSLQTFRGETLRRHLAPELRQRLLDLSKTERATPNMVFLAGLYTLLNQLTRSEEIFVGSAIAARTTHQVERMVGCLINTIVNRGDLTGNPSFREVIQRTRTTFLETLSHQDIPLSDIVRHLGGSRNADRSALFQVNFTYQNSAMGSRFALEGLDVEMILPERLPAKFDLSFYVLENHELPALALNYNKDLFRKETAETMLDHFIRVLEIASLNPDLPLAELFPIDSAPATPVLFSTPAERGLHGLIEDQADRTPNALAVAMGEDQLSYAQFDAAANALAHRLRALGVGLESVVAVYLTRSVEAMVALVGILKAGAAYLPLDLADPPARLAHAVKDSQTRILVTEHAMEDRIPSDDLTILWIDDEWKALCQSSARRPGLHVNPKSLAGMFYTSGSTGKPKGVAVQHDNLINFAVTFAQRHQLQSTDRVAQLTALSFDVSGEEIWPALVAGSSVHVGCEPLKAMPENLLEWLNLRQITICDLATPLVEITMDDQMHRAATLRLLITGGDRLRKWPRNPLPCKFINAYGPTETTIFSTGEELTVNPQDGSMPSIGYAFKNQKVYLLDARFLPVPLGSAGEIFIGGAGVTRGYFRNPVATADKFIPDPFSGQPGSRLYRTGDQARVRPDGKLDFIGRIDAQVQIRGFRVELGEIESALAVHPAVSLGAVTIQEDETGAPVIIAHALLKQGQSLGFIPLREFLSQRLPGHMLPARFAVHEQFPLTPGGKILRSALPSVDLSLRHVDSDYVQPSNDTETALAVYFSDLLGTAGVGLDDDFFDLGGYSLLIIQLLSHLKNRYGLDLPIGDFYAHATVRGLAGIVDSRPPILVPPTPVPTPSDDALRKIERRPLLSLFATRKLAPVDAAFVGYFHSALYASTGLTKRQIVQEWYDGMPTFRSVRQTFMGATGGIFLPRFENDLYEEPERLVEQLVECLELAGSIGARFVSLTGLIPSATAYGESLASAVAGRDDLPRITTGHATTGCTVALSMKRMLEASGRDFTQECLGFLGLGSIGLTSLELILDVLCHPAEIILCDLFMKRRLMEETSLKLREEIGFEGRIEILESRAGEVPEAFYRARTIVGATNVPGILDVKSLQPGTVIVDDSAPHCFDSKTAMARIREQGDLLVTEGGLVKLPEPAPLVIYRPEFIERAVQATQLDQPFHADEITGCVLSALLNAADSTLPLTIGRVPLEASRRHYRKLEECGFQPADLRCLGDSIDGSIIEAFRKKFGRDRT